MTSLNIPLASYEVRWFFEGWAEETGAQKLLHAWFREANPFALDEGIPAPDWKERRVDVYLMIPGGSDMGIKLRERQLQIKGRLASLGLQTFTERSQGHAENWVKWSYLGMPEAYRDLFEGGGGTELLRMPVEKIRGLRKIRVDPMTPGAIEVPASTIIDRGVTVELTNLLVKRRRYCTLGFEAFPDDSEMMDDFTRVVEAFLSTLENVPLEAANSLSYPEWLERS